MPEENAQIIRHDSTHAGYQGCFLKENLICAYWMTTKSPLCNTVYLFLYFWSTWKNIFSFVALSLQRIFYSISPREDRLKLCLLFDNSFIKTSATILFVVIYWKQIIPSLKFVANYVKCVVYLFCLVSDAIFHGNYHETLFININSIPDLLKPAKAPHTPPRQLNMHWQFNSYCIIKQLSLKAWKENLKMIFYEEGPFRHRQHCIHQNTDLHQWCHFGTKLPYSLSSKISLTVASSRPILILRIVHTSREKPGSLADTGYHCVY